VAVLRALPEFSVVWLFPRSISAPKDIYAAKPDDELLVCLHFDVVTPVPANVVSFDKYFGMI
jgi:hypothetical protein